jgi:hypothetical protein
VAGGDWREAGGRLEGDWRETGEKLEGGWREAGRRLEGSLEGAWKGRWKKERALTFTGSTGSLIFVNDTRPSKKGGFVSWTRRWTLTSWLSSSSSKLDLVATFDLKI